MPGETRQGRTLPWAALAAVALLGLLVAAWFLFPVQAWIDAFVRWIGSLGAWGPVLYALAYALALVVMAPGAPLSIGAGLAFGLWGIPVVLVGATAGAGLAFLVSRHLLRQRIQTLVERQPALKAVDEAVAEEGWRIVGLLRLSPLVPFNLQNYFFGVTRVGFWPYLAATMVGMTPGVVLYVYLGALGRSIGSGGAARWVLLGVGLVATVAVAVLIGRRARAMLARKGVNAHASYNPAAAP